MRCKQILSVVLAVFLFITLLASCSSVRHVRPVEKGELTASATFGGPFAGQIGWAPFPMLSLGTNYGVLEKIDIEAGWTVTSALFGVCELDGGCNWRPLGPAGVRPGVMVSAKALGATDFQKGNSRFWPDVGATALWRIHERSYCYRGMENWFETHTTRFDGNEQAYHWLPVVYSGIDYGGRIWQWQIEAKWFVPNIDPLDTPSNPVQTIGIGGYGSIGVYIGVSRSFGKIRDKGRKVGNE
jgi:hypothetical protein